MLTASGAVTGQVSSHPKGIYIRFGLGYAPMVSVPGFNTFINPLLSLQASNNSIIYEVQWQSKRHFGAVFQYRFITLSASIPQIFYRSIATGIWLTSRTIFTSLNTSKAFPYQNGKNPVQALLGCSYAFDIGKWGRSRLLLSSLFFFAGCKMAVALKHQSSNQLSILTLKPNNNMPEGGSVC